MTGPTLFDFVDTPLPARTGDPATSRLAARLLPVRARQQEVLDAIHGLDAVAVTADDITAWLHSHGIDQERNEVASRLSELERLGRVRKSGVAQGRRGRPVATWRRS